MFSRLARDISSKHDGDYYCYHCLHSFWIDSALEKHERLCKEHDFCEVLPPNDKNEIIKHNFGSKSLRQPYTIYLDLECLQPKFELWANDSNKPYHTSK